MKKSVLILFMFYSACLIAQQEGSFTMTISSDTVLMGNTIQLSYSVENLEGQFIAPDLSDFRVVSGPNVSSQFSSVNGKVTQSSSYSYHLLPLSPGVATIGSAELKSNESVSLDGANIAVLDNPHGLEQQYGQPFKSIHQIERDSLSENQIEILKKLKSGKRRKI